MQSKNLFIIFYGASGSGKSALLHFAENLKGISIHQKDTTRPSRKNESKRSTPELRFVKNMEPKTYAVVYKKYGSSYGVRKAILEEAMKKPEPHLIIINDITAIKKFRMKYPNSITVYVYSDPREISKRFKSRGKQELIKRRNRIKQQYLDFVRNNTLFDRVVVNFGDIKHAKKQFLNIVKLYKNSFN